MSKSKGNVVTLDSIAKDYGADLFRMYAVGTADFASVLDFRKKDIQAARRTLNRFITTINHLIQAARGTQARETPLTQWISSKFESCVEQSTRALEEYRLRDYIQKSFYQQLNDFEHFLARASEAEKTLVAREAAKRWLALLAPITPHVCEELWRAAGEKTFVSLAQWPAPRKELINPRAETAEDYVSEVTTDVIKLIGLVAKKNIKATRATIITASHSKANAARELVRASDSPDALRGKTESEELAAFLEKRFYEYRERPELLEIDEHATLSNALAYIAQKTGLQLRIESEEKSASPRASRAMPGKPAVTLE
jgi:leucyl-tRNA synthetase